MSTFLVSRVSEVLEVERAELTHLIFTGQVAGEVPLNDVLHERASIDVKSLIDFYRRMLEESRIGEMDCAEMIGKLQELEDRGM